MMALTNTWHLRTVADSSAKPCWIDYKNTTAVLITPDNKDFFYICRGHLKDTKFCTPLGSASSSTERSDAGTAAEKEKHERALQAETEALKKEYEEKQAKNKKTTSGTEGDESKAKDQKQKEKDEAAKSKADDNSDKAKGDAAKEGDANTGTGENLARIYSLHRNFFQMRLDRIKNAEAARRNRERFKDPNLLPSVPKGDI